MHPVPVVAKAGCGQVLGEFPDEEEDEIDPFDALGIGGPSASAEDGAPAADNRDPLDALLEDDPDFDESEFEVREDETFTFDDEGGEKGKSEPEQQAGNKWKEMEPKAEVEQKKEPVQADPVDTYRLLLETVWVDDVLDPAEVALLARKRESLEISFETHLQMVREIIVTDVDDGE